MGKGSQKPENLFFRIKKLPSDESEAKVELKIKIAFSCIISAFHQNQCRVT